MAVKTIYHKGDGSASEIFDNELEPDIFHIPDWATESKPPDFDNTTHFAEYDGNTWSIKNIVSEAVNESAETPATPPPGIDEEEERKKQQEEQDRIAGPIPDIFIRNRNSDGEILSDDGTVITRENLKEKGNWLDIRMEEYGTPEYQLEYITEHGLEAWQKHVQDIKDANPKPS